MLLITSLVFISVTAICYALLHRVLLKRTADRRLTSISLAPEHTEDEESSSQSLSLGKRLLKQITTRLQIRNSRSLQLELQRAGIELMPSEFVAMNLCTALAPLFLVLFGISVVMALLMALIGAILPSVVMKQKQRQRLAAINSQIPEVLITISNSLRAGYSFMQAIDLVSREADPPLATEFGLVIKEMNLGAATETALQNIVQRVNSDDLDLMITAVIIQRQVGGNLAEILESIAETIRERIRIKGEIKTLTAQGRISGMIIAALPLFICIFVYLINPGYMLPLFTEPLGQIMLGAGASGQVLAVILIRKIVDIQV